MPPLSSPDSVLVVDLDHTLIKTDVLFEQCLIYVRQRPLSGCFSIARHLMGGKASLKSFLAASTELDVEALPYRQEVLTYIDQRKKAGTRTILASATHESVLSRVSDHLGIFDQTIGTGKVNLKGANKLKEIERLVGNTPFSYIGDSQADLPIWEKSAGVIAVNPSPLVERALKKNNAPVELMKDRKKKIQVIAKQIRLHQWLKNLLVFVPLLAAHLFTESEFILKGVLAFFSFSLCASSVYILNDLLDINADRQHATKRNRPLAAGDLSIPEAVAMIPLFLGGGLGLAALLGWKFLAVISGYFVVNILYSFWLKSRTLVDVLLLSMMYTLRIFAGALAISVTVSTWLLAFSIFFFFGLAWVKRYTEVMKAEGEGKISGRAYSAADKPAILAIGAGSSLISNLIFVLYLSSPDVVRLYNNPSVLWLALPALLFWTSRTWLLAGRGEINDDPVVYAVKDPWSWVTVGAMAGAILLGMV